MDHTYVSSNIKNIFTTVQHKNMKRIPSKRKNRSRSPSPLTDLPLEVQLQTEDENGKLVPMLQIRSDILDECSNTCELCGRSFPNTTGLRTHERSHNGIVNNQPKTSNIRMMGSRSSSEIKFTIFPMLPNNPDTLTNVIRIEDESVDPNNIFEEDLTSLQQQKNTKKCLYQCGQCSESCTTSINLRQHLQKNHQPTVILNDTDLSVQTDDRYWKDGIFYVCTYCGKSFLHIVGFRSHWRRHEREEHKLSTCSSTEEPTTYSVLD